MDVIHIRAYQQAKGLKNQAISKSIGGSSSQIHLAADSNGISIHFLIHDGAIHDLKVVPRLFDQIDLKDTEVLCTDKGYDTKALRE